MPVLSVIGQQDETSLLYAMGNLFILLLFSLPCLCSSRKPFTAVWNVPSAKCRQRYQIYFNLSNYLIDFNKEEHFNGEEISLIYEPRPGLYPRYLNNGSAQNGGLPQNADLQHHLSRAADDIKTIIPNKTYHGIAVIDWESWRPIFKRNQYDKSMEIYVKETEKSVQKSHPSWNKTKVEAQSQYIFETAARKLMYSTLTEAKNLRPSGRWGFYGFPRCYNYQVGERFCANTTLLYNDRLNWLFSLSSALYPSIYLPEKEFPDPKDRRTKVLGTLGEALRVHRKYMSKEHPVFAYTTYRYTDTQAFYSKIDLINTIEESFNAGLDGVVIWGSSKNVQTRSDCQSLKTYIEQQFGPYLKYVISFALLCGEKLCNNHGKCEKKDWSAHMIYSGFCMDLLCYKCECYKDWKGDHCDIPINY